MCCHWKKRFVPLWGILTPGMWPCGWHGTTEVAIPFHPSAIFHPAPFVFHLQKQNCSPFSSCENMASQKALWGVSISRVGVLWLPQRCVSGPRWKKKTLDIRVIALEITRSAAEFRLKSLSATGRRASVQLRSVQRCWSMGQMHQQG